MKAQDLTVSHHGGLADHRGRLVVFDKENGHTPEGDMTRANRKPTVMEPNRIQQPTNLVELSGSHEDVGGSVPMQIANGCDPSPPIGEVDSEMLL